MLNKKCLISWRQNRDCVFGAAYRVQFLFRLDPLHFHNLVAACSASLLAFVFLEIKKQKHQISDAEHESKKFANYL